MLELGSVEESVVVVGGSPIVQTTESSLSTLVGKETIVTLPLNGRNPLHLIGLEPRVVGHSAEATSSGGTATHYIISRTGSAASMCLALAVGRGDMPLARLDGEAALARPADVVVIGRRDDADEPWYGQDALRALPLLDLPHATVRERGPAAAARFALERLARPGGDGFWIHVDADVLDPGVLPAVDSPELGGREFDELGELLTPLVRSPKALGLELTIYDPALDPDGSSAAKLAEPLERVLGSQDRA
ncbi:MAG TPA: arginase family protein [Vicinamibacterales bacterium]|nr:arginase family protein [Vicinamibacterales bacterium]